MDAIRSVLLLVSGMIHVLAISGVLGAPRLAGLYGVGVSEINLLILMQHRAVLLGLLGVFLIVSAFRSALQVSAIIAGLISTLSFVVIAVWIGDFNESIQRVVFADLIAIACLLGATATLFSKSANPS